jgi:hypothetical protein
MHISIFGSNRHLSKSGAASRVRKGEAVWIGRFVIRILTAREQLLRMEALAGTRGTHARYIPANMPASELPGIHFSREAETKRLARVATHWVVTAG